MKKDKEMCLMVRGLVKHCFPADTNSVEGKICLYLFEPQLAMKMLMCKNMFESECTTKHMFSKKHIIVG